MVAATAGLQAGNAYLFVGGSTATESTNNSGAYMTDSVDFGLGTGSDRVIGTSILFANNYDAGADLYNIGAAYAFAPTTRIVGMYTISDKSNPNALDEEYDYKTFMATHKFTSGIFENLETWFIVEQVGKDADETDVRLNFSYRF